MIVQMSAKGLLTIPPAIRRKFGLTSRSRVNMDVDERNHIIVLTPITRMSIQGLRGRYKGKGLLKALKAEKENRK